MRIGIIALAISAAAAAPLLAQDSTAVICHAAPCVVTFEWGSSSSNAPDPDRRYGAPTDLESSFLSNLQQAGFSVTRTGQSATTLLVRLTPQNKALCDVAVGTNPDYSCHTVQRANIVIQGGDSKAGVNHVDVNPRCTDPQVYPSYAQFGRFAAEYFVYMVGGQKGERPRSIKC